MHKSIKDKVSSLLSIVRRSDARPEDKAIALVQACEAVLPATPSERSTLAAEIIKAGQQEALPNSILTRAAEIYLAATRDEGGPPGNYNWLVGVVEAHALEVGRGDPSLEARRELVRIRKMTTALDGLVVPRLGGGMVRLRSLRGRVVVMSFWATWCAPCRAEMPILEMMNKSAARKNVSVLAITDEDESTVRRYIRQNGFSVPILIDRGRKIFDRYQVSALPVTKIFDGNGHLSAELTLISESALLAAVEEAHIPSATRAPR